ncbi:unnamed protein product [Urochloa humidicola]
MDLQVRSQFPSVATTADWRRPGPRRQLFPSSDGVDAEMRGNTRSTPVGWLAFSMTSSAVATMAFRSEIPAASRGEPVQVTRWPHTS